DAQMWSAGARGAPNAPGEPLDRVRDVRLGPRRKPQDGGLVEDRPAGRDPERGSRMRVSDVLILGGRAVGGHDHERGGGQQGTRTPHDLLIIDRRGSNIEAGPQVVIGRSSNGIESGIVVRGATPPFPGGPLISPRR